MNYGVKATKKRIRAANSRKKKYANRLFLTFFKTAFVLVLFLCVTGVSTFIGMFKGILDSSPDFNPDSFTPSGYFSTIYNSAGEVTNTRSSSADEALRLVPPKIMSLEQCLDYIDTDELLEITPTSLRIRKKILDPTLRKRAMISRKNS